MRKSLITMSIVLTSCVQHLAFTGHRMTSHTLFLFNLSIFPVLIQLTLHLSQKFTFGNSFWNYCGSIFTGHMPFSCWLSQQQQSIERQVIKWNSRFGCLNIWNALLSASLFQCDYSLEYPQCA